VIAESRPPALAVTFDVGQVLLGFEPALLVAKLAERGGTGDAVAMESAMDAGWQAYGEAVRRGEGATAGWKRFIATILRVSGASLAPTPGLLDWLYSDNRPRNLWRRPVPGLVAILRALRAAGVPVAAVSNSEGALAELLADTGLLGLFDVVADSTLVGHEKPAPAIFHWALGRLGVAADRTVHIGDSWAADVEGAVGVGARAIWFPAADDRVVDRARVWPAQSPDAVREGLVAYGVPRHVFDAFAVERETSHA
jgi:putative hydrolase of the HAD superfamily